ncbi:hypothetical protein QFC21_007044 [Naganishia friedmannii]|uniref:Uncharacterized protein n=1 Tax=Naganishia friedmannii TaxID=89922 RepID=A0ACC2UZN4_9TREE|nr:hypothetical protein QFC21_007044 [Naganishia friedmannii]
MRIRTWFSTNEADSTGIPAILRGNILALADALRPEATDVIQQLKTSGFRVHMLSGDNKQTARAVAAQLGFEDENVIAEVLPEEKGKHIARLQERAMRSVEVSGRGRFNPFRWLGRRRGGESKPTVMFVGDGLNDSVALATADVAVALSHGAQASIASADFVLLNSSLNGIPALLRISSKVYRVISN